MTFFPNSVPFPRVKLDDFLQHAAQHIITILTNPPSTKTPILEAIDHARNALLNVATQLKRVDTIPQQQQSHKAASMRVQTPPILKHTLPPEVSPRVVPSKPPSPPYIPIEFLQQHSKALKTPRFRNTVDHSYPLRLKGTNFKHLAAQCLLAQHMFQHTEHHIFRPNRTKETIKSVLKVPAKDTWNKILSN